MTARYFVLFVISFTLLFYFYNGLANVFYFLEKSSVLLLGIYTSHNLAKTLKKILFDENLSPENKAVLITGCDSGFGFELTKRLDVLGYKVFAACYKPRESGALKLIEVCSSNVTVLPLDVKSDESVDQAKEFVSRNLEKKVLWAVVNNAGVPQAGEIDWTSMDEIKSVFEVNTFGTVRVTKAFLPLLKASRGRIVNTTSAVGRFICPGFVGYCMSKSAAIAFVEGLRIEMSKWGVAVISIEPFFYKTPLTSKESALELAIKTWDKADPSLRAEYGESYFEQFKSSCNRTLQLSSSKIYQVIDCLEEAITSKQPESSYFPAYLPHKIGICCLNALPAIVRESYQKLYLAQDVKKC